MDQAIGAYVARVTGRAIISHADELRLARRWRNDGDVRARNQLLEAHLGFVLPIARSYHRAGMCLQELIAEGNLGLLRALDRFDPERGFRFVSYAKHWVRVHVSECALRNRYRVFRDSRLLRKVRRAYRRASGLQGEGIRARELAAALLGLSSTDFDALFSVCEQRRVSCELALAELELPREHEDPEHALIRARERVALKGALNAALRDLDARERVIVERRLMADPDSAHTLLELAGELGVSRERVRQLEARLKERLRARLDQQMQTEELTRKVA